MPRSNHLVVTSQAGCHPEKGAEAPPRPSGNKCGTCFVTSASLCCVLSAQVQCHPARTEARARGPFSYRPRSVSQAHSGGWEGMPAL